MLNYNDDGTELNDYDEVHMGGLSDDDMSGMYPKEELLFDNEEEEYNDETEDDPHISEELNKLNQSNDQEDDPDDDLEEDTDDNLKKDTDDIVKEDIEIDLKEDTIDKSLHMERDGYQGDDGIYYPPTYDATSGNEGVLGNVPEAMEHWEFQGPTNECAVFSQKFALEQLTGQKYNSDELVALAEENGWFDNGTKMIDIGNILEYHGMSVDRRTGDMDEIENALSSGKQIIVALDSGEIWGNEKGLGELLLEDVMGMPGSDANHAVQVIGIDRSDPENPMVILNDSGHPGGKGEMIPLDEFEGAWEDSGNYMVLASNENGGLQL